MRGKEFVKRRLMMVELWPDQVYASFLNANLFCNDIFSTLENKWKWEGWSHHRLMIRLSCQSQQETRKEDVCSRLCCVGVQEGRRRKWSSLSLPLSSLIGFWFRIHYVAKANFRLTATLLPQPLEFWDYRCEPLDIIQQIHCLVSCHQPEGWDKTTSAGNDARGWSLNKS